jgi:hypothetical protein
VSSESFLDNSIIGSTAGESKFQIFLDLGFVAFRAALVCPLITTMTLFLLTASGAIVTRMPQEVSWAVGIEIGGKVLRADQDHRLSAHLL